MLLSYCTTVCLGIPFTKSGSFLDVCLFVVVAVVDVDVVVLESTVWPATGGV